MKTERPVYLSLTQFKWPLAAMASITHRITGVLLFIGIAFLLYLLELGVESERSFAHASALLEEPLAKFVLWAVLGAVIYHLVAGVKHLFLDFHIGDSLEGASIATWLTLVTSAVLIVLAGAWLW
jgi:succinate dehydrogenase / fumarate reductase cytochrome b subunit